MKNSILSLWYFIEALFNRIRILFGYKFDKKCIPKGRYCYELENNGKDHPLVCCYIKKVCRYYRSNKHGGIACMYLGFYGFDLCLYDQCKICDVNIK